MLLEFLWLFENFIMFWCKRISIKVSARIAQLVERVTCMRETRTREISRSQVFPRYHAVKGSNPFSGFTFEYVIG